MVQQPGAEPAPAFLEAARQELETRFSGLDAPIQKLFLDVVKVKSIAELGQERLVEARAAMDQAESFGKQGATAAT